MEEIYDFYIPEKNRGKGIYLNGLVNKKVLRINIPLNACYLDVNTLEDEEEFNGDQNESSKIQIFFYDSNKVILNNTIDIEGKVKAGDLMSRLEKILKPLY